MGIEARSIRTAVVALAQIYRAEIVDLKNSICDLIITSIRKDKRAFQRRSIAISVAKRTLPFQYF